MDSVPAWPLHPLVLTASTDTTDQGPDPDEPPV